MDVLLFLLMLFVDCLCLLNIIGGQNRILTFLFILSFVGGGRVVTGALLDAVGAPYVDDGRFDFFCVSVVFNFCGGGVVIRASFFSFPFLLVVVVVGFVALVHS